MSSQTHSRDKQPGTRYPSTLSGPVNIAETNHEAAGASFAYKE